MLSRSEVRRFYDRLGARQDGQAFYEDPATDDLIAHARFDRARSVVELGCGTGRFAEKLLAEHLPPDAYYLGLDLSSTMAGLSRERLSRFGDRAEVRLIDGEPPLPLPAAACDRFVANYLFDLLSEVDIRSFVAEAGRLLEPGGLLCATGLAPGAGLLPRLVSWGWRTVHRLRPAAVGGCRPLELTGFLPSDRWRVIYRRRIVAFGLTSEVVVARHADGPPGV